jgi:reverse gyrase
VKNINTITLSFAPVYQALKKNKAIAPKTKIEVEQTVKEIEKEVEKGGKARVSFIQQRLENIAKMAPDIADVVIATLQNPAAGIGVALRKVLTRMQSARAE